jgi:hypothetical protein
VRARGLCIVLGIVGALLAGCGDDADEADDAVKEPEPTSSVTTTNVEEFLLKDDEVPGLRPVSAPTTPDGPPFQLDEAGTERMRHSGYISTTYQPAEGRGAGVSSVLLFHTPAGAKEWMAYETSLEAIHLQIPGAKIKRFDVAEVPGGTGWTGPDIHGNAIGQVYWTQGRCMLLIGLEIEGPRVARLVAGAQAIYERTGGDCPG